jgi:ABC-type transport system involved in multi-copper enzyme maturation permease subunit
VLILLGTKIVQLANPDSGVSAEKVFSRVLVIYIQLLIPVLALLFGTLNINEEIDHKTLIFLTTAPIPKPSILVGKFAAFVTLSAIIVNSGFVLCFIIININHFGDLSYVSEFLSFMGVGILALITYMAIFTLMGALLKKALVLGLMFIFGWENVVQYFPGATQKLTVSHYLKSMLPPANQSSDALMSILTSLLERSSTLESITVLLLLTVITLIGACYIFQNKEYVISDAV